MQSIQSLSASIIDDLRYLAKNCLPENKAMFEQNLSDFAFGLIAPGCPPPVENSEPRSVTVPGEDGQGVGILQGVSLKSSVLTKVHRNPSGAVSWLRLAVFQSSCFFAVSFLVSAMLCHSPIAAIKQSPQKMKSGVHVIPIFPHSLISALASNFTVIVSPLVVAS